MRDRHWHDRDYAERHRRLSRGFLRQHEGTGLFRQPASWLQIGLFDQMEALSWLFTGNLAGWGLFG
jgi:hypothetical protein